MTLNLWRALNNPPATHPIFVRTVVLPRVGIGKRRGISAAGLIIGLVIRLSEFMPTLLIVVIPFLLAGSGLVYGLDCAMRVSQRITAERRHHTYPLLALCPAGELAVCWAICMSAIHQHQYFARLHEIIRVSTQIAVGLIGLVLLLFTCVSIPIIVTASRLTAPDYVSVINVGAVLVLVYSEFVQSTIIGCLVGLIIPTFSEGTVDSLLYAPALFLLVKIGCWVISVLIGFTLLEQVYTQFALHNGLMDILLTVMRVMIVVVVQDIMIRGLWRIIIQRTDTLAHEIEFMFS